jgi:hypothetical protein
VIAAGLATPRVAAPDLDTEGPPHDAKIGKNAKRSLSFAVRANDETLNEARWILDARDVTDRVVRRNGTARFSGTALPDGDHVLTVTADGRFRSRAERTWTFTIDRSPPQLRLADSSLKAPVSEPMRLTGTVEEDVAVLVAGRSVPVDDGRFSVEYRKPPAGPGHPCEGFT